MKNEKEKATLAEEMAIGMGTVRELFQELDTPPKMQNAVKDVILKGMTLAAAGKAQGKSRQSIHNYLKKMKAHLDTR